MDEPTQAEQAQLRAANTGEPMVGKARLASREGRWAERYTFQVEKKFFSIEFLPVLYRDEYDDAQLAALRAASVYEVSFWLERVASTEGDNLAGYGVFGTGNPFQILGGVANAVLDWSQEKQPNYLLWCALEPNRQRLYARMIRAFAARGSGLHRLSADPFTQRPCKPETFWLARIAGGPSV